MNRRSQDWTRTHLEILGSFEVAVAFQDVLSINAQVEVQHGHETLLDVNRPEGIELSPTDLLDPAGLCPSEVHGQSQHAFNESSVLFLGEPLEQGLRQNVSRSFQRQNAACLQEGDPVELHVDAPLRQHDEADTALQPEAGVGVAELGVSGEDLSLIAVVIAATRLVLWKERIGRLEGREPVRFVIL